MKRLFVDTSAWFALVNRKDADHRAVRDLLRDRSGRLVTSNFVFDESVTLCRYRMGHEVALRMGEVLMRADTADMVRITAADERAAWSLFRDRADKDYSFTDCTSFVLMRRLRIQTAIALDEDFEREGFQVVP